MSSPWNKQFAVIAVSRYSLHTSGIPAALVAELTDEDMQAIADEIHKAVLIEPIEKIVEFVARLYIAEKGSRHGNEQPMQQASHP